MRCPATALPAVIFESKTYNTCTPYLHSRLCTHACAGGPVETFLFSPYCTGQLVTLWLYFLTKQ